MSRQDDTLRGVCRSCGCTDLEACVGGCYWADDTRTLCSNCSNL